MDHEWISAVCLRIKRVFRRRQLSQDLDEEIHAHLDIAIRERIERGENPSEAEANARREFGNAALVKEVTREIWGWRWLETFVQDVRYGLRQLRSNPGFTIVTVLTLAPAIGANTAIFTLIDAVMLRMLPVENPAELYQLQYAYPDSGGASSTFSNPVWVQVRDHRGVFASVFAWSNKADLDLSQGGLVHDVDGIWVSGGFFSALGLRPAAGRLIAGSDDRRGCPAVAVLSYGFWQDHYGGAKRAIGSTLSLSNHAVEVIGVTPPGFFGMDVGESFDVALPICATTIFDGKESRLNNNNFLWLNIGGRLSPKLNRAQLAARLKAISPKVFTAILPPNSPPDERLVYSKVRLSAVPVGSGISSLRRQFGGPLEILMAVVGLVLLIACANIASLMSARAASRHKEIAVRLALGASRTRLIRQLLTECILLSSAGALLGILFAHWCASLLVRTISTQNTVFLNLSLDGRTFGFVLVIATLMTFLFGLLPAFWSTRISLTSAIKGSPPSEAGRSLRLRGRKLIVAAQVALSLVLLIAAGLLLRSFVKLATLDIGFDRNNVLLVDTSLKAAGMPSDRWAATYGEIESRLSALPGVLSVGRSLISPMSGAQGVDHSFVHTAWKSPPRVGSDIGGGRSKDYNKFLVYLNYISAGYLPTLRMRLLAGRNFTRAEVRTLQAVAIINQTFAHRFFPNLNPIGKVFLTGYPAKPFEVVGLMEDSKYSALREEARCIYFLPVSQAPAGVIGYSQTYELRTRIPPSALAASVQAAAAAVSKEIPLKFHSLADQVNDSLVQDRLVALLSGFFGALALLLAMIGLYGTFNYLVTQRQTEFGIRMALGAQKRDILRMVTGQGLALTLAGMGIGIIGALGLTRFLSSQLYDIKPTDPLTYVVVSLTFISVALVATYIPARRASGVDPMATLRSE